jgi:hypothetical protein
VTGLGAAAGGLRRVSRSWGLGVLLLVANVGAALVLAAPLAATLAADFKERPAARAMTEGFDYRWWSRFSERSGWEASLGPDLLGGGFALKNADVLLKGQLPAGLFAVRDENGDRVRPLAPLILAVGAGYLLLQVFLSGGVLAVLRQAQGRWTTRALIHGAGFYFGRFLRITLLMLLAMAVVFALNVPLARWADTQAREAVSERTAHAWLFGRHLALLAVLAGLHLVGAYARVITVVEERRSAALAVLSGLAFAARNLPATLVVAGALAALYALALALWLALDSAWTATGYASQLVLLAGMQLFVLARIQLRLSLAGALLDLYRARSG